MIVVNVELYVREYVYCFINMCCVFTFHCVLMLCNGIVFSVYLIFVYEFIFLLLLYIYIQVVFSATGIHCYTITNSTCVIIIIYQYIFLHIIISHSFFNTPYCAGIYVL